MPVTDSPFYMAAGGLLQWGNPQARWMVYFMENPTENPIEMDDDWRYMEVPP